MATSNAKAVAGKSYTFGNGPWYGVLDTPEPFDDTPQKLQDLVNGYLVDPTTGCGVYARPGFVRSAPNLALTQGQASALWTHTSLAGVTYRFAAVNGKLYRLSGTNFATQTDVTPVGVTIDTAANPTARFYMRSFADTLIFTDGVHRPWLGTNLGSTPITGTYIDIDSAGTTWTSTAPPVEYTGSLFFIVSTYAGAAAVQAGVGIVWCEPNQPSVGYCQTNYADFWNLIQQTGGQIGALALTALAATNNALYYFRRYSIGSVQGVPSLSFSGTATRDLVSQNIGTAAPGSITQFGPNIFFVDVFGRPFMFTEGGGITALWEQMRGQINANPGMLANQAATALVAVGCVVPQLNLVALSGWSSNPTGSATFGPLGVNTLYCFEQDSGTYMGRWQGTNTLVTFDALAIMNDPNNTPTFSAFSQDAGLTGGTWLQALLSAGQWQEVSQTTSATIPITAQTTRMGYAAATEWTLNVARAIEGGQATPMALTTVGTNGSVSQGPVTPPASADGTYLAQWAPIGTTGRGFYAELTPTTTTTQWQLYRTEIDVTAADVQMSDA